MSDRQDIFRCGRGHIQIMGISHITSTSNTAVKNAVALRQKKYRDEQGLIVFEGMKMLKEAVSAGLRIKSVFVLEDVYEENVSFLNSVSADDSYTVNDAVAEKISDWKTPQGIVSIAEKPKYCIDKVLNAENSFVVILDGVADPGNIGTIIRTSEAAAVSAVITTAGSADCFQPKALRASMGSIFRIPVFENSEKCDIIYKMQSNGFSLVSTSLSGKNIASGFTRKEKTAVVFGNEGAGISKEFVERSDMLVRLPMSGKVESLNVAVSAGIIMYMLNMPGDTDIR